MDRRELETESLDAESQRVAELLGGLKRVEAPSNFEFGVRARIASGAPVEKASLIPILKVVAPLTLLVMVAVMVVLYQRTPDARTAKVEEVRPSVAVSSEGSPTAGRTEPSNNSEEVSGPRAAEPAPLSQPPGNSGPPFVASRPTPREPLRRSPRVDRQPGWSLPPQALTPANIINQPGIPSDNQNNSNSNSGSGSDVAVSEILEMLGVSAEPVDSGWKVSSTKEGSLARKSGVRSGDVIEAIDGREITKGTTFKGPSGGKTIRVRRDGNSLDLKLTN